MAFRKLYLRCWLFVLLACLGALAVAKWDASVVIADSPQDVEALRVLQARVETVAQKVMPAVVAVETPGGSFWSGVIISADGLVLTQFHVSHRYEWDGNLPYRSRQPGEFSSVILSDGRRFDAELLGADQTYDLSLLRILDRGPHPHVPLTRYVSPKLGDWVLKLGHPMGYLRGRPPAVRLGRVLYRKEDVFVTDCYLTGGDSGGPFFDLEGRLMGIPFSSSTPAGLQDAFLELGTPNGLSSDRLPVDRAGPFSALTSQFVHRHFKALVSERTAADRFDQPWRNTRIAKCL
jgi:S1-C subfamily serine protease